MIPAWHMLWVVPVAFVLGGAFVVALGAAICAKMQEADDATRR